MKATGVFQASGPRCRVREDLVRRLMRRYGPGTGRIANPSNATAR